MLRFWSSVAFASALSAFSCGSDTLTAKRTPAKTEEPPPVIVPTEDALLVSPESILFTVNRIGAQRVETVRILNQVDLPVVTLQSVEVVTAASGFTLVNAPVELATAFGDMVAFDVQYVAAVTANVAAEVVITSSWGDPRHVPVTVVYSEAPTPCIRVTPTSIGFGTVVRDGTGPSERTFTIQNCDVLALEVQRLDRGRVFGIMPTPAEYQWHPNTRTLPFTLAASESEIVTVSFTPGTAGSTLGAINVISNATSSPNVVVSLSANVEPPPIEDLDVHLQLDWDVSGGSDVDLHFYPQGQALFSCADCFFSNRSPDWGVVGDYVDNPYLDYDDLQGPGPENTNIDVLPAGSYIIAVHYYSDTGTGDGGSGSSVSTNATLKVYFAGVLSATYTGHLDATNRLWTVARLDWPSRALTQLGTLSTTSPSGACVGGP